MAQHNLIKYTYKFSIFYYKFTALFTQKNILLFQLEL